MTLWTRIPAGSAAGLSLQTDHSDPERLHVSSGKKKKTKKHGGSPHQRVQLSVLRSGDLCLLKAPGNWFFKVKVWHSCEDAPTVIRVFSVKLSHRQSTDLKRRTDLLQVPSAATLWHFTSSLLGSPCVSAFSVWLPVSSPLRKTRLTSQFDSVLIWSTFPLSGGTSPFRLRQTIRALHHHPCLHKSPTVQKNNKRGQKPNGEVKGIYRTTSPALILKPAPGRWLPWQQHQSSNKLHLNRTVWLSDHLIINLMVSWLQERICISLKTSFLVFEGTPGLFLLSRKCHFDVQARQHPHIQILPPPTPHPSVRAAETFPATHSGCSHFFSASSEAELPFFEERTSETTSSFSSLHNYRIINSRPYIKNWCKT